MLQEAQRKGYFTSCCCKGDTKTFYQPQMKTSFAPFSKERSSSDVSMTTLAAQVSSAIRTPLPELHLCLAPR